jgi:cytochrome d ubiquinol oxidase subunit I
VLAPLLAYEGLTAFFLEASFLGVLLFGRKLVPPLVHFFAGLMVAAGTLFSTFWILSVNSWMQTPAGFHIADGRFFPDDWWAVIFNPSFPYRYAHNVTAFYITTGFVVLGVGAFLLRRDRSGEEARLMIRMALNLLIILVPVQMILGDLHGLNTRAYQPAKLAAIEGRYDTAARSALTLFGIPDDTTGTMQYAVEIPALGSLLLTHSWDGEIKGLNSFPSDQRPPMAIPFFSFRIMVGIAVLMLLIASIGQILRMRGRLDRSAWFLRLCQWTAPLGFVAVIAGWVTTEVGRQSLTGTDVAISFTLYILVYLIMFPTGIAFMAGIVRRGAGEGSTEPAPIEAGLPASPYVQQVGE